MDPSRELLHPKPYIEIVYAGGTISSLATAAGYREGGHVVDLVNLLEQNMPGTNSQMDIGDPVVAYTGLSENIDESNHRHIGDIVSAGLAHQPKGLIVTHGTDSMEQTARILEDRFQNQLVNQRSKIILTGANDDVASLDTDVWENLAFAFESAASDVDPGVYVAFHSRLIPAHLVAKEPFDGRAMNFMSIADRQYLKAVQEREEMRAYQIQELESHYGHQFIMRADVVDYPVNIIRRDHSQLLEYVGENVVRAVLFTLYHSGTANTQSKEQSVAELAARLRTEHHVAVFACTENGETVDFNAYETSVKLREAGIASLGAMDHDVALAKLSLVEPHLVGDYLVDEMLADRTGEAEQ